MLSILQQHKSILCLAAVASVLATPVPGAAQQQTVCETSAVLNVTVIRGDRNLTVTWTAIAGVSDYTVMWSAASDASVNKVQVQGTTGAFPISRSSV